MKTVDTASYLDELRLLCEQGRDVSVPVSGGSMAPFVGGGRDTVYFRKPERALRKGDVVFYRRRNGQYVMHRIAKCRRDGTYWLLGDAQTVFERGIAREMIFARVYAVQRKGRFLRESSLIWKLFQGPWLWLRPLRPLILAVRKRL